MLVNHKKFGKGIVSSIAGTIINIEFKNGEMKKFAFPDAFDSFIRTDDEELLNLIEIAKGEQKVRNEEKERKKEEERKAIHERLAQNAKYKNRTWERGVRTNPLNGEFNGPRSQTIVFDSENERWECIGYLVSHAKQILAEVPKNGMERDFEREFPDQPYSAITVRENRATGLPVKLAPQFRIVLDKHPCENSLRLHVSKDNRINRSGFVLDLVQNYDFRFGNIQDVEKIRAKAVKQNHLEDFERGMAA